MFRSVRVLLFGGVAGKVLGIVRELVSAALFGTGLIASAYRLAQSAFLIPVQGFMSDSLNSGFIPVYVRDRARDPERSRALFAGMHVVLLTVSSVIATGLIIFANVWVSILAPGFEPHTAATAVAMIQLMALAMPCYAATALYAAADLAAGAAGKSAVRAGVQSTGLVAGTVLAWCFDMPLLIAAGFVAAYVTLAIWGAVTAASQGLRLWPRASEWPETRNALQIVWSAYRVLIWVPALMQIHFIVERRIASVANPHAIAALDYARFVSDTAVLLLAMPFGLAGLAAMAAARDDEFRAIAWQSLRLLLYIGIPISAALCIHAGWAVRVAFGRGAFDAQSVAITTAVLQTLAIGIFAQLVGYAGLRFLSARGKNRQVLSISALGVIVNIALNLLLSPQLGVSGLGLAASANSLLVMALVLRSVNLLGELLPDLCLLAAAVAGYVFMWECLPEPIRQSELATPLLLALYWLSFLASVPRSRHAVAESWRLMRLAR